MRFAYLTGCQAFFLTLILMCVTYYILLIESLTSTMQNLDIYNYLFLIIFLVCICALSALSLLAVIQDYVFATIILPVPSTRQKPARQGYEAALKIVIFCTVSGHNALFFAL